MSKQKQLLPCVPYIGTRVDLFEEGLAVHYEEWNQDSRSYKKCMVSVADESEAAQVLEYLKVCQLLEPLIRFLVWQEQALRKVPNYENSYRKKTIGQCKKVLQALIKPTNQTCLRISEQFDNGVGKMFSNALTKKETAKGYQSGQDLLEEMRQFLVMHHPKYQIKTIAA